MSSPAKLVGKGFFGGELEMASTDNQRPVRIAGRGGYVGILVFSGNLKVRCAQARGASAGSTTEEGTVYLCAGQGGVAAVLGSHFKFRVFAAGFHVLIPAGMHGTFHRYFVQCSAAQAPSRPD